jgi:hypothetical protein
MYTSQLVPVQLQEVDKRGERLIGGELEQAFVFPRRRTEIVSIQIEGKRKLVFESKSLR